VGDVLFSHGLECTGIAYACVSLKASMDVSVDRKYSRGVKRNYFIY
jgi:hypothetical protein